RFDCALLYLSAHGDLADIARILAGCLQFECADFFGACFLFCHRCGCARFVFRGNRTAPNSDAKKDDTAALTVVAFYRAIQLLSVPLDRIAPTLRGSVPSRLSQCDFRQTESYLGSASVLAVIAHCNTFSGSQECYVML